MTQQQTAASTVPPSVVRASIRQTLLPGGARWVRLYVVAVVVITTTPRGQTNLAGMIQTGMDQRAALLLATTTGPTTAAASTITANTPATISTTVAGCMGRDAGGCV
ncbi:hypothetical protein Pelo_19798 [Pelomyxa schiedti]|nr:hypothetical protein Pelo_19798 [Pelomyxa schiedti]